MGCCLSRTATNPSSKTPHPPPPHIPTPRRRHPTNTTTTPPLDEETVKEVLTETPFPEPPPKNDNKAAVSVVEKQSFENAKTREEEEEKQRIDGFDIEIQKSADIDISEITVASENRSVAAAVSLSVSVSESVSVGGVEKRGRGGGEEVMSKSRDRATDLRRRQRSTTDQSPARVLKRRPYSGEQPISGVREKRVRSPAKRTVPGPAPSPEKRTNINTQLASRAARGRSQSPATSNPRSVMNTGSTKIRRDSGDKSGRRSRSPARVNRSGSLTEVNEKVNSGQRKQEVVRRTGTVEDEDEACRPRPADESLDNPLVSLECFIFL